MAVRALIRKGLITLGGNKKLKKRSPLGSAHAEIVKEIYIKNGFIQYRRTSELIAI